MEEEEEGKKIVHLILKAEVCFATSTNGMAVFQKEPKCRSLGRGDEGGAGKRPDWSDPRHVILGLYDFLGSVLCVRVWSVEDSSSFSESGADSLTLPSVIE